MPQRIALTGGIGSGKSYVCQTIARTGAPIFYADDEAKRIIRTDPQVRAALIALVGPETYDAEGRLVKSTLAFVAVASTVRASTPLFIRVWNVCGAIS